MPITRAAYKHVRQTKLRTLKNRKEREAIRSLLKKTEKALAANKPEDVQRFLAATIKALDKAAQHGLLKKNATSRKKSRLMKKVRAHASSPKT